MNWLLVALTLVAVALVYPIHRETLQSDLAKTLPVRAADFILANKIEGRIFNTYHTGGYLIFRLYPGQRVFVYPRTDYFQPGFLQENLTILTGGPNWKTVFEKYRFDYVICESTIALRQLLLEGREFRLVYDDGLHSVLLRDEERFRPVIREYERPPANRQ